MDQSQARVGPVCGAEKRGRPGGVGWPLKRTAMPGLGAAALNKPGTGFLVPCFVARFRPARVRSECLRSMRGSTVAP